MSAKPYWVLALSLFGVAFAGPLVRLSNADPVAIAAWRLAFSLLIVGAFLVATGEWRDWRKITSGELILAVAGGVSLALHFWAWNASIHLTTIAASVTASVRSARSRPNARMSARWLPATWRTRRNNIASFAIGAPSLTPC